MKFSISILRIFILLSIQSCSTKNQASMNPKLDEYCKSLENEFDKIDADRKKSLEALSSYITQTLAEGNSCQLIFICTHNSRRSHFGQIWAQTASCFYGIENIQTYSGGTASTAFNPRSVVALERAGFDIRREEVGGNDNPIYLVSQGPGYKPNKMFSKKFDHEINPGSDFAAIMVCSDADENCPFVPGAEKRFAITYEDPKVFDNTPQEEEKYDERCRQIGREIFYAFSKINA